MYRKSVNVYLFFVISFSSLYLYCPIGISPAENSGCFPRGKPAATESRYPTYGSCWVFQCFHNPPNSDIDNNIFHVRRDVNACDCTRGARTHVRESALKVDSGRKIPCSTEESNLRQRRNGPMLYQGATPPPHVATPAVGSCGRRN